MTTIAQFILAVPALLFAVTIHEVSHGWMAYRRGDPTAFLMGRLTLNPLRHLDIFGSFLFPAMLLLLRSPFVFGWAKPVPVDFFRLRNPKRDMIWVSLAGPGSNLLVAAAAGLLFRLAVPWYQPGDILLYMILKLLFYFVLIDTALAVFNLIPIPPLDGSKVLAGLLPNALSMKFLRLERYGMYIFLALIIIIQLTRVNFLTVLIAWPVAVLAQLFAGPGLMMFL